jgi:general secretion pathway protein E
MAEAAIQTGHKILTTVHATSALGVIGRLCSSALGLSRDSLCAPGFISALVYQVLMPLNCPHCKLPATSAMAQADLQPYHDLFGLDLNQIYVASEQGCEHCRIPGIDYSKSTRVGVKGVKVAAEILLPDERMLQLLLKGDDFGAKRYWAQQRVSGFDVPDMTGKEAWGHVLYDISRGGVDPFYFEYTFGAPILYRDALQISSCT